MNIIKNLGKICIKKILSKKTNFKNVPIHKTFEEISFLNKFEKDKITENNFLDYIKKKKFLFSEDWFTYKINLIKNILDEYQTNPPDKILELGSFEGLSMIFFQYLYQNSKIDVVDILDSEYKKNFDQNLNAIDNSNIQVFKKRSHEFLVNNKKNYDLIFVDGGHGYLDVLVDLLYAYKFLNVNGILLIDDYDWDTTDKTKSVRLATNHFFDTVENTYTPIYHGQFAAIKKNQNINLSQILG